MMLQMYWRAHFMGNVLQIAAPSQRIYIWTLVKEGPAWPPLTSNLTIMGSIAAQPPPTRSVAWLRDLFEAPPIEMKLLRDDLQAFAYRHLSHPRGLYWQGMHAHCNRHDQPIRLYLLQALPKRAALDPALLWETVRLFLAGYSEPILQDQPHQSITGGDINVG